MEKGMTLDDLFEGAREAGYQLVKEGKMSEKSLQKVRRKVIDQKTYVERVNKAYEKAMETHFRGHPLSRSILGSTDSITQLTSENRFGLFRVEASGVLTGCSVSPAKQDPVGCAELVSAPVWDQQ